LAISGYQNPPPGTFWFMIKNSIGPNFMSVPDSASSASLGAYKNTFLRTSLRSAVVWSIANSPNAQWYACAQMPADAGNAVSSLATLNNTVYLVSTAGVYKAQN
jgi:hypothetical protein